MSQAPLLLVFVAMASGRHERVVASFRYRWARIRPAIGRRVIDTVLLVGAFFVLDAGWWIVTGESLVLD